MTREAIDQAARTVQREMAAEWLKLAEAALHPVSQQGSKRDIAAGN
jgi:hypothetical protein